MADQAQQRLDELLAELHDEFPRFRIVAKRESRLQRVLHYGLVAVTLGRVRDYMDSYHNTVGSTVYVTDDWDDKDANDRYVLLCHEREHMRQFRRFTAPGMMALYWLLPLPFGLAYFRARFERAGYEQTIRASAEVYGLHYVKDPSFRDYVVRQFIGAGYGWMWPFRRRIETWYDEVVADIERTGAHAGIEQIGPLEEFTIDIVDPIDP